MQCMHWPSSTFTAIQILELEYLASKSFIRSKQRYSSSRFYFWHVWVWPYQSLEAYHWSHCTAPLTKPLWLFNIFPFAIIYSEGNLGLFTTITDRRSRLYLVYLDKKSAHQLIPTQMPMRDQSMSFTTHPTILITLAQTSLEKFLRASWTFAVAQPVLLLKASTGRCNTTPLVAEHG